MRNEQRIQKMVQELLGMEHRGVHDGYTFYNNIYLTRLIEKYVEEVFIEDMRPDIIQLYKDLEDKGFTKDKQFIWNDLDNTAYVIENVGGCNVMVMTNQNCNFIVMFTEDSPTGFDEMHIRQFFAEYDQDEELVTIDNAEWITEFFSDYNHGVYCDRPSLQSFKDIEFSLKDNEFPLQYLDARDKGYVLSYKDVFPKVDIPLSKFHLLGILGLDIQFGSEALNKKLK